MLLPVNGMAAYLVIVCTCFVIMILSTILNIEIITYVQKITPTTLTGKVMARMTCLVMCGNPVWQAVYGVRFETLSTYIYGIYFSALLLCMGICAVCSFFFCLPDDAVMASCQPEGEHGAVLKQ